MAQDTSDGTRLAGPMAAAVAALALAVAAVSFRLFASDTALVACLFGWAMLAVAVSDAQRFTIPDVLSLPAIPLGLLASGYLLDPSRSQLVEWGHVAGAGLGGGLFWLVREAYFRLRGREGLGLGDVKLAAAGGAWTGWEHLADVVLLAATPALAFAMALAALRRRGLTGTERVPFGAFLAPAIWAVWVLRTNAAGL
jgi:leader peptidase (prepilin peptidase)/N-methyltransferase